MNATQDLRDSRLANAESFGDSRLTRAMRAGFNNGVSNSPLQSGPGMICALLDREYASDPSGAPLCLHIADVIDLRTQEEMTGEKARRVVAVVEYVETLGDWPHFTFPSEPMDQDSPAAAVSAGTHGRNSIAKGLAITGPLPTTGRRDRAFGEDTGRQGHNGKSGSLAQNRQGLTHGYVRGREVEWDDEVRIWRWSDNGEPAEGWGGESRPCPACGCCPESAESPDPCLGRIEGAASACCGHGVHVGYVNWPGIPAPAGWRNKAYVGE